MSGFVYFAKYRSLPRCKIGFSHDPVWRARALNAVLLGLIHGDREEEKRIHKRFSRFSIGGEWFKDVPSLRKYIQSSKAYEALREAKPTTSLISFYPEDALWEMVKTQAKKDNRSMAAMVCEIVRRYFAQNPR